MFSNILKWNFCFNFEDEGRPKIITIFVLILSEATPSHHVGFYLLHDKQHDVGD